MEDKQPLGWYIIAAPGVELDKETNARLVARAHAVLEPLYSHDLLGPDPGFPVRPHVGVCRLCAAETDLTFEHIPPRSAGNTSRRRGIDAVTSFQQEDPLAFPEHGWFPSQRGVGASVLCGPCNNWCGANLVPDYSELANDIVRTLSQSVTEQDGVVSVPERIQLYLPDYRLGAVARQALVMLLAASGGAALVRRWPVLQDIVRGAQTPLPEDLRLGVSLVFGPRARLVPPSGVVGPGDKVAVFIEAAFMPFAWTLTLGDGETPVTGVGVDASSWLAHGIEDVVETRIELSAGTVQTAGPGDYRDRRAVTETIDARRAQLDTGG